MSKFEIKLDDKPALTALMKDDVESFKMIVKTFVNLMEVAADNQWHMLPSSIHTSLSFDDIVTGVLNAIMSTRDINPEAYIALESDLHPLALLSDKRKNFITGENELYDWKSHFILDDKEVTRETLEHIIRKMLYLMRWFDVESISKALITQQFPIVDAKDVRKLPFQPALQYQKEHLGELYVGKFLHDIGAFNCGTISMDVHDLTCPACKIKELTHLPHLNVEVCERCNAGFQIEG